jgi:HEAT repeat protein
MLLCGCAGRQAPMRYTVPGSPMRPLPDSTASLPDILGHLILLFRSAPDRDDWIKKSLDLAMARLEEGPALIEGGIENNWGSGGDPLKERLQLRQIEAVHISAGAPRNEVLGLLRALADDFEPVPSTDRVRVRFFAAPMPPQAQLTAPARTAPVQERTRSDDKLAQLIESVLQEVDVAVRQQQWHTVLHDVQAVLRMLPGLSDESRRMHVITLRRLMPRPVIEALIDQAYRVPEEQQRTAEVLRGGGMEAAELILDILRQNDTVGPRAFLVESLGGMPDAYQVIAPLARSGRPMEARLGAELLGRLGIPAAIPLLATLVRHSDERVRLIAIDALGRYRDKSAVEPLRQALGHPSAAVRARAGRALAARGSGAIAMLLLAALEAERDPATWEELLGALARIDAPEAAAALSRIALARRGVLGLGGGQLRRQLAVVRALTAANTVAAKQALARIAAQGEGEVAQAAAAVLTGSVG